MLNRQGISQGNTGKIYGTTEDWTVAGEGELTRDLGQAIIQNLLNQNGTQGDLQIFLSHSRADIPDSDINDIYPQGVLAKIKAWIDKTKLKRFVHDLQSGDLWNEEIRQQARSGALLMVRTKNYSHREWTQWEVLEAKRFNTPIVCLDATTETQHQGSFIFDNVPRVTYPNANDTLTNEHTERIQALAIIEALNLLVDMSLKQKLWNCQFSENEAINSWSKLILPNLSKNNAGRQSHYILHSMHPPEPALIPYTLSNFPTPPSTDTHLWIVHPDPPLSPAEHEIVLSCISLAGFNRRNIHINTPHTLPLEITSTEVVNPYYGSVARLDDTILGISTSYSEDITSFGLRPYHLEVAISKIVQGLILCGGEVTYAGGQLEGSHSLTRNLLRNADQALALIKLLQRRLVFRLEKTSQHPHTVAHLTPLSSSVTDNRILDAFESVSRNSASVAKVHVVGGGEYQRNWRTGPLTESASINEVRRTDFSKDRQRLPNYCTARVAISGKIRPASDFHPDGYRGTMPGVIEEALYSLRAGQPLYIAGGFGGASALLSDVVNGTSIFSRDLYLFRKTYDSHRDTFKEIAELYRPESTGLTPDEVRRLAVTQRPYEVAHLVVKGLSSSSD